jgi:hypothetical protein
MNKKDLTLKDFPIYPEIVLWSDCEKIMGKRMYKRFLKYMFGQTTSGDGVYPADLDRFLKGLNVVD